MNKELPELRVRMLGGFSVTYDGRPLFFQRNNSSKAMKLLQILLYYAGNGISREELIDNLYGREEVADVANNLRVTVFRAKKLLADAGLPTYPYIKVDKGMYYWSCPMPLKMDIRKFDRLIEKSQEAETEAQKISYLQRACYLYNGELLNGVSDEDWMIIEGVRYKKKYFDALTQVCDYLKEKKEYEQVLKICTPACEIYPFDEWQAVRIECYIALNRYSEAMKEYDNTARMLFEELGVAPSEKIMAQFRTMSDRMSLSQQTMVEIKNRLQESTDIEGGAFYCSLPSFRDSYRLLRRNLERNQHAGCLMLCAVSGNKNWAGDRNQSQREKERQEAIAQELYATIKQCLRRGDSFTRYNSSQFLMLLQDIHEEDCKIISGRIQRRFQAKHKSWGNYLKFSVTPIVDDEAEKSKIPIEGIPYMWNTQYKNS